MLGHLKPRFCRLTLPSKRHYQHLYCSICYSLRRQFGLPASFFINHELTLTLTAFPAYTEMDTEVCACPAKLFCQQKPILRDPLIDKAAQLCVLLVWLKLVDWETDSPRFYKKRFRQAIEAKVQPVLAKLSAPTRQFIDSYLLLIRANSTDFSTSVKMSGLLASYIFQELNPNCENAQETLREITLLLGELITVADALLDLKQDIQQKQYNPIIAAAEQNHTSLQQEQALLKTDYELLVQKINELIDSGDLKRINPVFCEILQQSLHNLTDKIQFAHDVVFSASSDRRRNSERRNFCDCFGDCCESFASCGDCCQCCGDFGRCCSKGFRCCSKGEDSSCCCECGDACDCGGCDCGC